MDAQLKARWVKALRSGKYEQGQCYLQYEGRFCCLGVLCEVAGEALGRWLPTPDPMDVRLFEFSADDTERDDMLSLAACDKLGLPIERHDHLWKMNDEENKSFSEIADYIEREL